jgi:hypothetical protein
MILVDTSIWVDFFSKEPSLYKEELHRLIEEEEICLLDIVLAEILCGIREDREFEEVRELLLRLPIYSPKRVDTFITSAKIYRLCRKKGKTIRRVVDCLIAACCIERNFFLFHNDKDFDTISEVVRLRIYKI